MAARTWTQTSGNLWSTAANWNGGVTVPQAGDTVTFDATSTAACTVDNIGAFNGTITVAAAYTNTITQSAAVSGVSTIAISGGIWNCAGFSLATTNAAITVASGKQLQIGSNNSTSTGSATLTNAGTLTYSGTWSHSGVLSFSGSSTTTGSSSPAMSITNSITISSLVTSWTSVNITLTTANGCTYTDTGAKNSGTWTFSGTVGNVTVAASTTMALGSNPTTNCGALTLTVNGTLTYSGLWTHTGIIVTATNSTVTGSSSPSLTINGSLTIGSLATAWTSVNVLVTGSSNACTYTDTAAKNTGIWTITRTATSTVTIAASTIMNLGTNPTSTVTTGNSFVVNGTVQWAGDWTHTGTISSGAAGVFTGTSTPTISFNGAALTINATTTITNPIGTITLTSTATCTITDTGDRLSGTTYVLGNGSNKNVTIAASTICRLGATPTSNLGTGTLTVTGTLTYSGLWTHTGSLLTSASSTVTGSSSPSLSINQSMTLNAVSTWTSVDILAGGSISAVYTDTGAKNSGTWTISKINHNFTISASTACSIGTNPTTTMGAGALITINGTLTYAGTWNCVGSITVSSGATVTGSSSPSLAVDGDLNISATAAGWTSVNVLVTGSINGCIYTDTGAKNSGLWTFNKGAGGVAVSTSTTMNIGANPTLTFGSAGSFTVNGTLTASGAVVFSGTYNLTFAATGVISGAITDWTTTRNWFYTAGGVWPTGVKMHFTLLGTVTAPGIVFGISDIHCGTGAFTIAANTTVPLGANPTTDANLTNNGTITATGTISHTGAFQTNATGVLSGASEVSLNDSSWAVIAGGIVPAGLNVTQTITSATLRSFSGGGATYGTYNRLGSGANTINFSGSNTFTTFQDNAGLAAHTNSFAAGSIQTAANFILSGSSGKLLTMNSQTSGSQWFMHCTNIAPIKTNFLVLQDSSVDAPPPRWQTMNSLDLGDNTNWNFNTDPSQTIFFRTPGFAGGTGLTTRNPIVPMASLDLSNPMQHAEPQGQTGIGEYRKPVTLDVRHIKLKKHGR